jgi:hypothetical protein
MPQSVVDERYERWGGIARYVLEPRASMREAVVLDEAIITADLDQCLRALHQCLKALRELERGTDASQRLLHYVVNQDTFQVEEVTFGSIYLQRKLLHERFKDRLSEVMHFAAIMQGKRHFNNFVGPVYQATVLNKLSARGEF